MVYYSLRAGFGVLAGAAIIDAVVTSGGVTSVAFGFDGISGIGGAAVYRDGVVPLEVIRVGVVRDDVTGAIGGDAVGRDAVGSDAVGGGDAVGGDVVGSTAVGVQAVGSGTV